MATAGIGARSGRRRSHDQYGRMEAWFGSVPTGVAAAAAAAAADAAQCVTSPFVTSPRRTHPATAGEREREREEIVWRGLRRPSRHDGVPRCWWEAKACRRANCTNRGTPSGKAADCWPVGLRCRLWRARAEQSEQSTSLATGVERVGQDVGEDIGIAIGISVVGGPDSAASEERSSPTAGIRVRRSSVGGPPSSRLRRLMSCWRRTIGVGSRGTR